LYFRIVLWDKFLRDPSWHDSWILLISLLPVLAAFLKTKMRGFNEAYLQMDSSATGEEEKDGPSKPFVGY
jgi:hypothetical protein